MGDTWYIARPDNGTLFDFDKTMSFDHSIGQWVKFGDLLTTSRHEPIVMDEFKLALETWFDEEDADHADAVFAAAGVFADGHPVYLISEHDEWLEGDTYRRSQGGLLNVVAYRYRVHDQVRARRLAP